MEKIQEQEQADMAKVEAQGEAAINQVEEQAKQQMMEMKLDDQYDQMDMPPLIKAEVEFNADPFIGTLELEAEFALEEASELE